MILKKNQSTLERKYDQVIWLTKSVNLYKTHVNGMAKIYFKNEKEIPIQYYQLRRYSVMVITLDSESNNPSSTLGSAYVFFKYVLSCA